MGGVSGNSLWTRPAHSPFVRESSPSFTSYRWFDRRRIGQTLATRCLVQGDDTSDTVLVEDQGAVRVLTLNRPTKLNAMNAELVDTLIGTVRAADLDDAVEVAADDSSAVLRTHETWRVATAGGQVLFAETDHPHTITMRRVPGVVLHKWVVTDIR